MARAGARILDSGERLPTLTLDTVAHGRIALPDWFGERWGVLLVYRAHW
jgi:alkyl hydroperoxide reductase subunit AhpC